MATPALVVMPKRFCYKFSTQLAVGCQKTEKQFHQSDKSDAFRAADSAEEPLTPAHEGPKRRTVVAPNEWSGADEVAAVADEVPITREATKFLHRRKIEESILQDFVGRMRVVDHLPIGVVPND